MDKLTESQFHTVWTEAVGRDGYNKKLFQETLKALKNRGLITDNQVTCEGKEYRDEMSNCIKHAVIKSVCPACGSEYYDEDNNVKRCQDCYTIF